MSYTQLTKKALAILTSGFIGFGLLGCGIMPQGVNKDDSASITPQSTGEIAVASMNEPDSLAATLSIAGSGLEDLAIEKKFSVKSAVSLAKTALQKDKSDASLDWSLADTANGIARLTLATHTLLVETYDTILIRWDEFAKDQIPNNEHIISISGVNNFIGGRTERFSIVDADNDGILIDKNKPSSQVDISLFVKDPPLKPFVDSLSLKLRLVLDGNDSNNKCIRLSGEEYRKGGRIITVSVTDIHGNLDVMPYDTTVALYVVHSKTPGSIIDSVKFVFDVQSGLQNPHDNLLYELYIRKQHEDGAVVDRSFDFTTTNAVREGEKPKSGHFSMSATYRSGKTASILGDFTETGFSGVWTGPNGNTVTITWDRSSDSFASN